MIENLEEISLKIHNALFSNKEKVKLDGKERKIKKTSRKRLRYVDISGIRFIEQNPEKDSQWAKKARNGEQITWIIKIKGWKYLGQIHDGEFKAFDKD
ncbi:MAG: hypothetical protein GF353_11580 [Candidatus Lokiarchaeota archaeon]|nr:hypothetical protein [Candidatus Lokiarchaeota archaeon]